ncbi:MAG TPA: ABC transporter ATP-binding protein, partial [Kiritimatiellia bacterium]
MASTNNEWATYRRLLRYARPYLPRIIAGVAFGAIFGTSTTGVIIGLKKTLAAAFDPQALTAMEVLAVSALMVGFGVARAVGDYFSTYFIEWVGNRVVMDLRTSAFSHLQELSLDYYSSSRTGELISRVTNDTSQVERSVSTVLGDLAKQPFALVSTVGLLLWLDPMLAFIGLVLFPVCIIPVALFGRRVRRFAREGQQKLADLVSILQETVSGARIVKAFGMENYERSRFLEQCKAVFSRAMRVTRAKAAVEPVIMTISVVGLVLILGYVRHANMSVDQFFAFSAAMVALYDPIKKLSKIHISVQQSSAAADRIFELLDAPVTVKDRAGAKPFSGRIETIAFENVTFAYGQKPVLRDVTVAVRAGQRIALVGRTGSGKTTLVNLLPRFFDVTGGRILVNGSDLRDL